VFAGSLASLFVFAVLAGEMHIAFAMLGMAASVVVATVAALAAKPTQSAPKTASIAVDGDDVVIDGARTLKGANVAAHRDGDRLIVELESGVLHELRASAGEIEPLIDALGFGPGKRVVRLVVGGFAMPATQTIATIGTALLVLIAAPLLAGLLFSIVGAILRHREDEITAALVLLLPAALATTLAFKSWRSVRRTSVYVGGDGVRVEGRTFPFSRLHAHRDRGAVSLVAGVERVRIRCASEHEAAALLTAIDDARTGRTPPADVDTTALARGGDDVAAWKSRLLALLGADAYRATLGADELARVVEDTSASPETRVGAALALSSLHADAPERARVRVAIDGVADPKLRVALENAEAGDLTDESVEAIAKDES